ncbi:MAG: hypothetical protein QNK23_09915 [Crocinitomicaceae bacterium]|nr:hypothetical protein [Crocinitomicaceae bacterium]
MQSIKFHIKGLITSVGEIFKGKYLWFFLPGTIATILYLWFQASTEDLKAASMLESDYSWVDWMFGYVNEGIEKGFSLLDTIMEQAYIFFVITALSPFNTALAERLDGSFTGQTFEFNLLRVLNDFLRMIFVVILLLLLEIVFLVLYWLVSWFIGIELIDTIVYHMIFAFFIGISFYDFALERYQVGVFGTIGFGFSNPLSMLLTGGIFLGIYAIPYVGIPISPVIAVMVSTIVYLYITKKLPRPKSELKADTNE